MSDDKSAVDPTASTCSTRNETDGGDQSTIKSENDAINARLKANDDVDQLEQSEELRLKRKQSLEAQVTSGCGGGRKKARIVDAFYDTLWPILEEAGWKLVSMSNLSMTLLCILRASFVFIISCEVCVVVSTLMGVMQYAIRIKH